jgi:hypothetical protein
MPISREEARRKHGEETGHGGFSETIYGVICDTCRNYILIDHTNCPPTCREHDPCRQAYGP